MERSYWSSILAKRTMTRRRMMLSAGGVAMGGVALSLIGCGGGEEDTTVSGDTSGLLTKPVDTRNKAKGGGTWKTYYAEDVVNMDPIVNNASPTFPQLLPVYAQLVKAGISATKRPGAEDLIGDAAESWEFNGDGTQVTFKLRQDLKWDPRPPTNGRVLTAEDVKFSWDKFAEVGNSAAELVRARNPDAAVDSVSVVDPNTIVMKLAFPYAGVLEVLANSQTFYVMAKDDSDFNWKSDMRGTGPYRLESFVPSSHAHYVRNPDWYDSPRPYFERIEKSLLSDYAAGLSQFEAQNIWNYEVRPDDILPVKQRNPAMFLFADKEVAANARFWNYSKLDTSIFKDVRLRRALPMLLDRDLLLDTFFSTEQFTSAGLPIDRYWHSHIAAGLPEWLDPRGKDLGEGAKFFQYNPAEAKKLAEATGMSLPIAAPFEYFIDRAPEEVKQNEVMHAMVNEGGVFDLALTGLPYATEWRAKRQSGGTEFDGIVVHRAAALAADIILTQKYTPKGRNSVNALMDTPNVTELVLKQKTELDPKKRTAIIHEIQRNLAMEWPDVSYPGDVPGFSLRWPWLANHGVFIEGNASAKSFVYFWYDESKMTT